MSWFILNVNQLPGMSGSTKTPGTINLLKVSNRILHAMKPNSLKGSKKNIRAHYDLSNQFFSLFLDPSMTYSSALFEEKAFTLQRAQEQKYDSLCQAVRLDEADHVLEIGSGWGGFAAYAAKKYGCKVTGITISEEQFKLSNERIKKQGLSDRVSFLLEDYRKVKGTFDKVVSIEMIEAVGHKYFKQYFAKINELLKPEGALGLQAIIIPDSRYEDYRKSTDWIQKHIFPGGLLPSIGKINESVNLTGNMNLYSLKEMGLSYARTLRNWYGNFQENLHAVRELGFDDTFIRKWEYYLCSCEASFLQRNINVVQMVYARPNNPNF
jgi:cyclopropane-fatty-acyl-phospholipid synthase